MLPGLESPPERSSFTELMLRLAFSLSFSIFCLLSISYTGSISIMHFFTSSSNKFNRDSIREVSTLLESGLASGGGRLWISVATRFSSPPTMLSTVFMRVSAERHRWLTSERSSSRSSAILLVVDETCSSICPLRSVSIFEQSPMTSAPRRPSSSANIACKASVRACWSSLSQATESSIFRWISSNRRDISTEDVDDAMPSALNSLFIRSIFASIKSSMFSFVPGMRIASMLFWRRDISFSKVCI
mmetsp:Transcript_92333/g.169398  ORF Transcript_92333/g.169398 Transcript_92333/m.169398 type:complete len:245 (+) Transcript_92333:1325-2059(+)